MDPTRKEQNRKEVCEHIVWLYKKIGKTPANKISLAANHVYGEGVDLNEVTAELCGAIRKIKPAERDAIIYNGRDKKARLLAEWWDEHVAADKARMKAEREESKRRTLEESALVKLTPAERKAIGY
jgi:hypothetical protein